jgi:signal peptidase II
MFRKYPMFAAALTVFLLDQISKLAVLWGLRLDSVEVFDVAPPYLVFRMAWNRGVNFGLLADNGQLVRWLLIALAVGISAWIWHWTWRGARSWPVQLAAGILIGGALGNALDRLAYGAVADFLNMSCCGIENPYSFNLADVGVFLGVAGLLLLPGGAPGARTGAQGGKPRRNRP